MTLTAYVSLWLEAGLVAVAYYGLIMPELVKRREQQDEFVKQLRDMRQKLNKVHATCGYSFRNRGFHTDDNKVKERYENLLETARRYRIEPALNFIAVINYYITLYQIHELISECQIKAQMKTKRQRRAQDALRNYLLQRFPELANTSDPNAVAAIKNSMAAELLRTLHAAENYYDGTSARWDVLIAVIKELELPFSLTTSIPPLKETADEASIQAGTWQP